MNSQLGNKNTADWVVNKHPNLDRELARFEARYGLLSETFFTWYQSGQEPEDPDWVQDFALWAGTYQLKQRRQEKYLSILEIL